MQRKLNNCYYDESEILYITRGIAEALAALHKSKAYHGHVTTYDIMLEAENVEFRGDYDTYKLMGMLNFCVITGGKLIFNRVLDPVEEFFMAPEVKEVYY